MPKKTDFKCYGFSLSSVG